MPSEGWSRRDFLKGISASAALTKAAIGTTDARAQEKPDPETAAVVEHLPAAGAPLAFTLNGEAKHLTVEPRRTLLDLLRQDLGLTGSKEVCD